MWRRSSATGRHGREGVVAQPLRSNGTKYHLIDKTPLPTVYVNRYPNTHKGHRSKIWTDHHAHDMLQITIKGISSVRHCRPVRCRALCSTVYVNCQPNHRFGTVHHVAHWDFSCLHRSLVRNSRIAMLTHRMLVCSLELRLTFISLGSRPFYTENCPPDSFPGVSNPPAAVRLRSHRARQDTSPGRQRRKE